MTHEEKQLRAIRYEYITRLANSRPGTDYHRDLVAAVRDADRAVRLAQAEAS